MIWILYPEADIIKTTLSGFEGIVKKVPDITERSELCSTV